MAGNYTVTAANAPSPAALKAMNAAWAEGARRPAPTPKTLDKTTPPA